MTTPYDGKILLLNWQGRITPGSSVFDVVTLFREKMPNVAGIVLRTSNGVSWEGHLGDSGPLAVTGVNRIRDWAEGFAQQGLQVHVWGKPRAKRPEGADASPDLEKEADKFIRAAKVPGVKSLLLDVEHGEAYWQGTPEEAKALMTLIRAGVGDAYHIGMILDGRQNRPFSFWVDPWIPFVDSLHPMVYPIWFSGPNTIEQHLDVAFKNLSVYEKPIVPMLQAFGAAERRPTPEEITRQGNSAFARGAAGISFFRLGSDVWPRDGKPHMGEPEYAAIARIQRPRDRTIPDYTWQSVINAGVTVAARTDANWLDWFNAAGFWRLFDNSLRPEPYSGPPIEGWPIASELRQQMLELVVLDPDELRRVTAAAQADKDRRDKEEAAKQLRERGSIVGIHGAPGIAVPPRDTWDEWLKYLTDMGIKWYKQCDNGDKDDLGPNSVYSWALFLKEHGIEPIIRFLATFQFPRSLNDHHFEKMRRYAEKGVVWAEIGNEPNQTFEWSPDWAKPDETNQPRMRFTNPEAVKSVAEAWIKDAKKALDAGVRPAFYAFSPTDWGDGGHHPWFSSRFYTHKVVQYLAQHHRAATIDAFKRGAWIAVHAATYEKEPGFDPHRPNGQVWDMALRGYEVVLDAFRENFGGDIDLDAVPIMSTEGGVFTPESTSMEGRPPELRLKDDHEHAIKVVEMYRWLERNSPLQAMCPWCLAFGGRIGGQGLDQRYKDDGWFLEVNGETKPRAVYEAMRQLSFDHETEVGEGGIKLNVPYISQWDEGAGRHTADCGPTSWAMIVNAAKEPVDHVTVDELCVKYLADKGVGEFTLLHEMLAIGRGEGLDPERIDYPNAEQAMEALRESVRQGTPFVALINYAKWKEITGINFSSGHFVVVTGFDDDHVFVHDPLFRGNDRSKGEFFVWRNERFRDGWGSGLEIGNPNFSAIVPKKKVASC